MPKILTKSLTGGETGLVGDWKFSEGSGGTVADATANHNDGILGALNTQYARTWTAAGCPHWATACRSMG